MIVKSIEVKNFQSHRNSTVELDPGVNTFIGRSDHGKSAIMKAFLLVKDNRPGTDYVSNWLQDEKGKYQNNCEVTLNFDDGGFAKRVRGKDNQYWLGSGEESHELTAFGQGVPHVITEYFNMADLNIQTQDDNFFLFNKSNGEVMKRINSYVNLELIDTTLANADKSVRENRKQTNIAESKLEDIKVKLHDFTILPVLDELYNKANTTSSKVNKLNDEVKDLSYSIKRHNEVEDKLAEFVNLTKVSRLVVQAEKLNDELQESKRNERTVQRLVTRYNTTQEQISVVPEDVVSLVDRATDKLAVLNKKKQGLPKLEKMVLAYQEKEDELDRQPPDILSALNKLEALSLKRKFLQRTQSLVQDYNIKQERAKLISVLLEELHRKFHEAMPEVCPLCGGKI